jgi:hypothetical protein
VVASLLGRHRAGTVAAGGRGPLVHGRIGILRALNRNVERTFNPDRKTSIGGRRKLKRDQ